MSREDFGTHTERGAHLYERDRVHDERPDLPDLADVYDLIEPDWDR